MNIEEGMDVPDKTNPPTVSVKHGGSYVADELNNVPPASTMGGKSKKRTYLLAAAALVVIIAAILTGVLVSKNNDDNDGSKNKGVASGDGGNPAPTDPGNNGGGGGIESPTMAPDGGDVDVKFFKPDVGPFQDIKVPLQTSKIDTYDDSEELKDDLEVMCQFLLNNVAERGIGNPHFVDAAFGFPDLAIDDGVTNDAGTPNTPGQERDEDNGDGGDDGEDDGDSYGTNNQEENVDETDVSKSDGKFIFSLLMDKLFIVRVATEELVATIELPPVVTQQGQSSAAGANAPFNVFTDPGESMAWQPDSIGVALFLSDTTLAVVLSGHQYGFYPELEGTRIVSQYKDTLVQLYSLEKLYSIEDFTDVKSGDVLDMVGRKYINGSFLKGYMIGNTAVVLTTSYMNNVYALVRPFERNMYGYGGQTDDEFIERIKRDAPEVIDEYIEKLMKQLEISAGELPEIVKLGLPTSSLSEAKGYTSAEFGNGYANFFVQLTTFDMKAKPADNELDVKALVHFMSNTWALPYATTDYLVLASEGYNYNPVLEVTEHTTMLYRYKIDEMDIVAETQGSIPGVVMNKHSIDNEGTQLRVATTLRQSRPFNAGWGSGDGANGDGPIIVVPCDWRGGLEFIPCDDTATVASASSTTGEVIDDGFFTRSLEAGVDPATGLDGSEPVDLMFIADCSDLPDTCAQEFITSCAAVEAECEGGRMFTSVSMCQTFCESSVLGSQCYPFVEEGLHGGNPCVTGATVQSCLDLEVVSDCPFVPVEICPMVVDCATGGPVIDPIPGPVEFVPLTTCEDVANEACPIDSIRPACAEILDMGCQQAFMSNDCEFVCRDAFVGTPCLTIFDMAMADAVACPFFIANSCLINVRNEKCEVAVTEGGICNFVASCVSDPIVDPPFPVKFSPVTTCADAVTEACPIEEIEKVCTDILASGCNELFMSSNCEFFCKDPFMTSPCVMLFDMAIAGGNDSDGQFCPMSLASDCLGYEAEGCVINMDDSGACDYNPDCTGSGGGGGPTDPIPTVDLRSITDCSQIDPVCQFDGSDEPCNEMMNDCDEVYYSVMTCAIGCRDAIKGSNCEKYLNQALDENSTCITGPDLELCLQLEKEEGCDILEVESCPMTFMCADNPWEKASPVTTSCPSAGQRCMDAAGEAECKRLQEEGCEEIIIDADCAVTCFSSTTNQIFILEDDGNSTLDILGSVEFGKPNEDITAMLFRKERVYAVTYERKDPLYIIDLKNASDPTIIGALEVPGYSSYLYPINQASTMLLGIGQDAEGNGRPIGLKLSIFDVENPDEMKEVYTYSEVNQWSSAEHDDKAFRYRSEGDGVGTLVIPVTRRRNNGDGTTDWFDGFVAFSINAASGIEYLYEINHVEDPNACFYCMPLAMRSYVIDGNVLTQKGYSIVSTDIDAGTQNWNLQFKTGGDPESCCHWFDF